MTEQRAGDLDALIAIREIGSLDEEFHEVIGVDQRPDRVTVRVRGGDTYEFDIDEVVEVAERYLVSFGGALRYEPHPVLGYWPELGEDAVLWVYATDKDDARTKVFSLIGKEWCAIYGPTDPPGWKVLNLGSLEAAVQDPRPTSWTCGVQFTINADGTMELDLGDAPGLLGDDGCPLSVLNLLEEKLDYMTSTVGWVLTKD
jgi:hypothetical protein